MCNCSIYIFVDARDSVFPVLGPHAFLEKSGGRKGVCVKLSLKILSELKKCFSSKGVGE